QVRPIRAGCGVSLATSTSTVIAQVAERVNWLGLGPQENYPDRLTAACFDRWDLPLSDMYTPYVFPSENGLRCGTRELNYGPHQWRGDFQFNISRYSQQQLMETVDIQPCAFFRVQQMAMAGFH
ncbi:hypothetical protein ACUOFC_42660, partial [Escherichia sp. TWPC-MK]